MALASLRACSPAIARLLTALPALALPVAIVSVAPSSSVAGRGRTYSIELCCPASDAPKVAPPPEGR
ncbi:hypothetical protein BCV70DRAFT_199417 [Testicularia cyperi]|uniref:Ig-like domain-containing protein n=1 Tax=Testicularia cyperi TaxID=1882483 RepID=A0A317XT47_9BASI|nr:hypothetical protein BCV70DRAFT_199417 [Testicularia cyperi]